MAVCLVINVPGATWEQYQQVEDGLGEPRLGEGQSLHIAGPTDGGLCVIDVWESRAHFDRFMNERLGAQLQKVGFTQPEITEFPVQNQVTA